MLLTRKDDIFWLKFPAFAAQKGLWHGIFLRLGGVSQAPFNGLNLGANTGDSKKNVAANRRLIADLLPGSDMCFVRQVHGDGIFNQPETLNSGSFDVAEADAMISHYKGQYLTILVADCQAVLLADPVRNVVGNVHSGWRGSINNIIGKTVAEMVARHGCRPQDILAGIAPSLGPCCAEFVHYRKEIPSRYWKYKDSRDFFDFWAISQDQLLEAGLASQHIHISRICTRCNPHLFYSYRARHETGRFAAVIGLT